MAPRHMNFPSPRGVHVPETYASTSGSDYEDLHRLPRRNRYSRSAQQAPRVRDVTWISSPEPTPQSSHGPPTPWMPPPQVPSSPAYRPASAAPPSPAPTVGEHMALDDFGYEMVDPYRPQRQRGGMGLLRSFWNGLKKLSGHQYEPPYASRPSSYQSQSMGMPVPMPSAGSEGTQYVDPSPTEERQSSSPYASPHARPGPLGGPVIPGSRYASPVPSMEMPSPHGSPLPMPVHSIEASPRARPTNLGATPAVMPGALRTPPASIRSSGTAPPITVVSPSVSPSPRPSLRRPAPPASPVVAIPRSPPTGAAEPNMLAPAPPIDDASQTLHEPAPVLPWLDTQFPSAHVRIDPGDPKVSQALTPLSPDGSLASTIARFRQFVAGVDRLPWVSGAQIADEYVPADNPRSRMRKRVRQGAEPSWYNPRPVVVDRPPYLSEWDVWAMQSTAALWDGRGTRPGGVMYPRGYAGLYPPRQ